MSSESVVAGTICDRCGGVMRCAVREAIIEGRLRSEIESRCATCGNGWATCSDGPDDYVRSALLAAHGPSRLRVAGGPFDDDALLLGLLRRYDGGGLFEVKSKVTEVRTVGCIGTSVEMELLARVLRAAGYSVVVDGPSPGGQTGDTA
ncbi:hypothetical protein [Nocardia shimofusensis]|uniref:hypothetical protein n=1 Tax=Nocardia shimofusensis TaxID=228596 RepID=UPI000836019B|nr:hypothetical protein [Nocardia shimofusensis]